MFVGSLVDVGAMPTASAMLGEGGFNPVVDRLNAEWAETNGVIFGDRDDFNGARGTYFQQLVTDPINVAMIEIQSSVGFLMGSNEIRPLVTEESLLTVPDVMKVGILTSPTIRPHFESGRLYGWNIEPSILPDEDIIGRLIGNGMVQQTLNDKGKLEFAQEYIEWTWTSDDPEMTLDEVDMYEDSRTYFEDYLKLQMSPEGQMLDPTCAVDGGTIAPSKRKRK